jgi:hypothetical protein
MSFAYHHAFKIASTNTFVPACSVTRTNLLITHDESKVTCLRCKAYIRRKAKLGALPGADISPEQRLQNQLSSARHRLLMAYERLLNAHRAQHDSESVSRDLAEGDVKSICGITKAYDTETICPKCLDPDFRQRVFANIKKDR